MINIEYVLDGYTGLFIVTVDKMKFCNGSLSTIKDEMIKRINYEFENAIHDGIKRNTNNVDDVFDYYDKI